MNLSCLVPAMSKREGSKLRNVFAAVLGKDNLARQPFDDYSMDDIQRYITERAERAKRQAKAAAEAYSYAEYLRYRDETYWGN